jgi:hypothetical protein
MRKATATGLAKQEQRRAPIVGYASSGISTQAMGNSPHLESIHPGLY